MGLLTAVIVISWLGLRFFLDQWGKLTIKHLRMNRSFEVENCYVGDVLKLNVVLGNEGKLPISFLSLDMAMPEGVNFGTDVELPRVRILTHLGARRSWEQDYQLHFNKRGYFLFANANFQTTDYYGIVQYQNLLRDCLEMHVYPQLRPLSDLIEDTRLFNGVQEQKRWMLEDPLLVVGSRDYSVTDPMKYVHWSATAKTGTLQSKKMAFTTESSVMLIISVQLTDQYWKGWNGEMLEWMVETAAAVCHEYETLGHKYGLASNCPVTEGSGGVLNLPSNGRKHYHQIFRTLSKINGYASSSLDSLLEHVCKQVGVQTRLVIVAAFLPKEQQAVVSKLMALGYHVDLVVPLSLVESQEGELDKFNIHLMKEGYVHGA